ncbi:MAG: TIGR04283 family arsenosugar biosynthesis glycosyltransferase [Candidatus Tectomicrobia bacterium]|uniref:TIGR04283 family arsenosugar biosynthesis glycosyltransferase n=1 Tax=Tectimicrobiota bacterium TaxID=2528274 RepID=A0A933GMN0_UNCTE|nr:TIGR04283 family arsenosugar biosynthesis glycosyltransferase [Candidatus Tectomicrobia bacterium]
MSSVVGSISVVIPTLNECTHIASCLSQFSHLEGVEVIVVDGGSTDGTLKVALACGVKVLKTARGRGGQMNAGADSAKNEILLFLHADTTLPEGFEQHVRRALKEPGIIAGAFGLRIDAESSVLRLIERMVNLRAGFLQMPYGDQAIFLKNDTFRLLGGFPSIPIMEDFELVRRLKRLGHIAIVPFPVVTSARRWQSRGIFKATLINQFIVAGYCLGVSPKQLAKWYR